jgi:beta-lactamase superfamily II metal-dependent hydrolase
MTSDTLRQAVQLIKAGDKQAALPILKNIVQTEPNNEMAWSWLYSCVESVPHKKYCLQKVLEINPNNQKAREVLEKLAMSTPAAQAQSASSQVKKSDPQQRIVQRPDARLASKQSATSNLKVILMSGFVTVLLFCLCGVIAGGSWIYNNGLNANAPIINTPNASISPSSTFASTLTLAPTSTFTLAPTSTVIPSPTTLVIPILPVETNGLPTSGNTLQFYFFDVGQGDATLIQMPDGETVLIDGGETNTGIVSQLQSLGVQRIDLMIATHPHSDHIGGLVQVLQNFPVAKVLTNGEAHTTSVYEHFLDEIIAAQAEFIDVKRGDVISLGGIDFHILNPENNNNHDLNENSVVIQFTYGQTTFLMMGDSGADTESALLSAGLSVKADILKVGHHASTSGSTPAFLNAVQPKIALYFAGINNQYGHPAPQTIAALTAVGATVYGTDQNGTINIKVDMNGYTIKTDQNVVVATPALSTVTIATILPPSGSGGLEIMSLTSPISKGANATLTAKTSPNASCTITVYTKSGTSEAAGLGSKTADANGMVSWTWKVGARTTAGTWRIVVICNGVTKETTYEVQ